MDLAVTDAATIALTKSRRRIVVIALLCIYWNWLHQSNWGIQKTFLRG